MEKPVIILGANGIGKTVVEIFASNGIVVYGFLDDNISLHGTEIMGVQVLGSTQDEGFLKFIGHKCEAFVASDDNSERKSLVKMLLDKRKRMPVNAIHKYARISDSVQIMHGTFINDAAIIGTNVKIGNHCLIHSGAIINYESSLGNFVQAGAGCVIGYGVSIKDEVFIGPGAIIAPGITVGRRARVGAGSVVIDDVKENDTIFGNPAKTFNM